MPASSERRRSDSRAVLRCSRMNAPRSLPAVRRSLTELLAPRAWRILSCRSLRGGRRTGGSVQAGQARRRVDRSPGPRDRCRPEPGGRSGRAPGPPPAAGAPARRPGCPCWPLRCVPQHLDRPPDAGRRDRPVDQDRRTGRRGSRTATTSPSRPPSHGRGRPQHDQAVAGQQGRRHAAPRQPRPAATTPHAPTATPTHRRRRPLHRRAGSRGCQESELGSWSRMTARISVARNQHRPLTWPREGVLPMRIIDRLLATARPVQPAQRRSTPTATSPAASTTRPRPASRPSRSRRTRRSSTAPTTTSSRPGPSSSKRSGPTWSSTTCGCCGPTTSSPSTWRSIPQLHDLFWKATKTAGEAKKTNDPAVGQRLLDQIAEIATIFWETKK